MTSVLVGRVRNSRSVMENNLSNTGVVFIFLRPDNTSLLQLRDNKDKKYPNQWCFPGGRKDASDRNYIDTLLREAKEEFNVSIIADQCTLIDVYTVNDFVENNHVYICRVPQNQKLQMNEGADMKWMTITEIKNMNLGFQQKVFLPKVVEFISSQKEIQERS